MYLCGTDQIFVDLAARPDVAEAIFQQIHDYFMAYNRNVFEAAAAPSPSQGVADAPRPLWRRREGRGEGGSAEIGNADQDASTGGQATGGTNAIDIFMTGDDFGAQNGPLVSPEMWRRFFKRRFRETIDLAHSFNIKVMHHTCGSVRALVGEFIDCGLDVLQSLQPQAEGMDLAELKKEFGADIAFHGSIDIQGTLPRGTPEDVRREVKTRMEAGKRGGGFIISTAHNILPDTPTENILALFDAYREYGAY